jgi:hypothetical protein
VKTTAPDLNGPLYVVTAYRAIGHSTKDKERPNSTELWHGRTAHALISELSLETWRHVLSGDRVFLRELLPALLNEHCVTRIETSSRIPQPCSVTCGAVADSQTSAVYLLDCLTAAAAVGDRQLTASLRLPSCKHEDSSALDRLRQVVSIPHGSHDLVDPVRYRIGRRRRQGSSGGGIGRPGARNATRSACREAISYFVLSSTHQFWEVTPQAFEDEDLPVEAVCEVLQGWSRHLAVRLSELSGV